MLVQRERGFLSAIAVPLALAIASAPLHATASAGPAAGPMPETPAPTQPDDATTPSETPPSPEPTTTPSETPPEPAPAPATTPSEPAPAAKPEAKTITPKPPVPAPKPAPQDDEADDEKVPQRLPPMQTAGWWTLFGGFAIGTVAGVLAGLAEREEDHAVRLSVRYDLESGAQPQYEDIRTEYENSLRKGRAEANAAIGLAVVGLGAAVAGLTVLLVGQLRDKKAKRGADQNARVRLRGGGLQVRF